MDGVNMSALHDRYGPARARWRAGAGFFQIAGDLVPVR
jgi:hypothetical protein